MSVTSKGKIAYALQAINLIPLLLFGLVIMGLGTHYFTRTMYDEVEIELRNAANDVATLYDVAYPGDYELVGEEGPNHNKKFLVQVSIKGAVFGRGSGRTKKAAEQEAAYAAILKLKTEK